MQRFLLLFAFLLAAVGLRAYDFKSGRIYYNVKSDGTAEVTFSSLSENNYSGDLRVPMQVLSGGRVYNVTSVGIAAFFNCPDLTSVVFSEGIRSIGQQCFSHCYALKSVSLPSTLTRIDDYAFEYCEDLTAITLPEALVYVGECCFWFSPALREVTSLAPLPPSTRENPMAPLFESEVYAKATLSVPEGSEAAYGQATGWSPFQSVVATGIENIEQSEVGGPHTVYDLSGRRASRSTKGLVIQNGRKIVRQ